MSSSAALNKLIISAKGDLLGGSSLITGTGQTFALTTTGGNTANLAFTSPTHIYSVYTESSPLASLGTINLTSNFGGTGYLQIEGNGAVINANSVSASNGNFVFNTAGDVNLNSVSTGGGYLTASSSEGNINVHSVTTLGASVDLTSDTGSILKTGASAININTANSAGASSGTVSLSAANGSVGVGGSPLTISKTVDLTLVASNEIAIDMNASTLTNLYIKTGASGTGAISIANNPNYSGFSLTRSAGNLDLGPVMPTTVGNFYLTATDGNIRVNGDINVTNLKLDARDSGSNPAGDVIIRASGGPRSVTASGASYLYAGHDFMILAGAASAENVSIQAG